MTTVSGMVRASRGEINLQKYGFASRPAQSPRVVGSYCMADESSEIVRRARTRSRVCLALAGVSCVAFLFFLVLLARSVQQDPLGPLRDVRFSALGVGGNFALALGSVVAFGYWRRIERARAARRGAR